MQTTALDTAQTIRRLATELAAAISRGDVETAASGFYADDAQFHAPNAPPAIGRAQIRGALQSFIDGGLQSLRLTTIDVGGDETTWSRGRYEFFMETPDGPFEDRGTFVTVFRREEDGLRRVVDIFNSDRPA